MPTVISFTGELPVITQTKNTRRYNLGYDGNLSGFCGETIGVMGVRGGTGEGGKNYDNRVSAHVISACFCCRPNVFALKSSGHLMMEECADCKVQEGNVVCR